MVYTFKGAGANRISLHIGISYSRNNKMVAGMPNKIWGTNIFYLWLNAQEFFFKYLLLMDILI